MSDIDFEEKQVNLKALSLEEKQPFHTTRNFDLTPGAYNEIVALWEDGPNNFVHLNIDGHDIKMSCICSGASELEGGVYGYEWTKLDKVDYVFQKDKEKQTVSFSIGNKEDMLALRNSLDEKVNGIGSIQDPVPYYQETVSFNDVLNMINKDKLDKSDVLSLARNLYAMQAYLEHYPNHACAIDKNSKIESLKDKTMYKLGVKDVNKETSKIQKLENIENKKAFLAKKNLMKNHPVMLESCLTSMCLIYNGTQDAATKKEMLSDLYKIRKGGKTNKEKRNMAKIFKDILDTNPSLKENANLVALSKVDNILSSPTKVVKKQYQ